MDEPALLGAPANTDDHDRDASPLREEEAEEPLEAPAVDVGRPEGHRLSCQPSNSSFIATAAVLTALVVTAVCVSFDALNGNSVEVVVDELDATPTVSWMQLARQQGQVTPSEKVAQQGTDTSTTSTKLDTRVEVTSLQTVVPLSRTPTTPNKTTWRFSTEKVLERVSVFSLENAAVPEKPSLQRRNDGQILPLHGDFTERSKGGPRYVYRRSRFLQPVVKMARRRRLPKPVIFELDRLAKRNPNVELVAAHEATSQLSHFGENSQVPQDSLTYIGGNAKRRPDVARNRKGMSSEAHKISKFIPSRVRGFESEKSLEAEWMGDAEKRTRGTASEHERDWVYSALSMNGTESLFETPAFFRGRNQSGKHAVAEKLERAGEGKRKASYVSQLKNAEGVHAHGGVISRENREPRVAGLPTPCTTSECRRVSRFIEDRVDVDASPCDDFHRHVCGRLAPRSGDVYTQMRAELSRSLRALLNSSSVPSDVEPQTATQKAVAMFRACTRFPGEGVAVEVPRIRRFLASVGISLTGRRPEEEAENPVLQMLSLSLRYALHAFVAFRVPNPSVVNGTKVVEVLVSQSDRDWLRERQELSAHELKEYYADVLLLYEGGPLHPELVALIPGISNFETRVHRLLAMRRAARWHPETHSIPLQELADEAHWDDATGSWQAAVQRISYLAYGTNDTARSSSVALSLLNTLTEPTERFRAHRLVAWSLIRQLVGFGKYAPLSTRSVFDIEELCIRKVSDVMEPAIQGLALLRTFNIEVRHHVEDIFGALVGHLTQALRNEKYLRHYDAAARLEALRSLADTDLITGFPDNITTESELERIFGSYPDVGETFWDAWIRSSHMAQKRVLKNVGSPDVGFSGASVNAAFFPCLDKVIVPAGLLRPPVFVPGAPSAYHYGTIGTIIARALMSGGCGTESSLCHSALNCINWWEPLAKSLYERQTHCAGAETLPISDYAYSIRSRPATRGSELAIEVASSSVAYRAFRGLLASERGRQPLPSLNYTADQLFFVANCALRCHDCSSRLRDSHADSGHVGASVDGDALSCGLWRCNEVAKRMSEFAAAFSCSKGSPMNPRDRCVV